MKILGWAAPNVVNVHLAYCPDRPISFRKKLLHTTMFSLSVAISMLSSFIVSEFLQAFRQVSDLVIRGADLIREATLRGIELACSSLRWPGDAQHAKLDGELLKKVIGKIECFTADGAADEQLAGRELASGLRLAGETPKELDGVLHKSLPQLKVVLS